MKNSLSSKVALITGGTSGIGRATALALASEGVRVVVAGRREREGAAVAAEIKAQGGEAIFVRADVTSEADVIGLVRKTVETYGRLDIAFNNAGIEGAFGLTIAEQTEEQYERVFDANVKGVLFAMKHEIPAMLASGGGSIVNNASIGASIGFAGAGVYVASKHAVLGLSRTAALEFAAKGIRVNTVSPAGIQTEMFDRVFGAGQTDAKKQMASAHPVGRVGTPEEVASAVVWLSSSGSAFVTGHDLIVDGGFTVG